MPKTKQAAKKMSVGKKVSSKSKGVKKNPEAKERKKMRSERQEEDYLICIFSHIVSY